jgi:hypothetical protein
MFRQKNFSNLTNPMNITSLKHWSLKLFFCAQPKRYSLPVTAPLQPLECCSSASDDRLADLSIEIRDWPTANGLAQLQSYHEPAFQTSRSADIGLHLNLQRLAQRCEEPTFPSVEMRWDVMSATVSLI